MLLGLILPASASAQWPDVRQLGLGGEPFVAADGKGNVYVTSHMPAQLLISRNYGESFGDPFKFRNALGDLHIVTWGEGRVHLTYMLGSADGLKSWFSTDAGKNLTEGEPLMGPFDREWIAVNPQTHEVYLAYSDGYIGGPPSKGIFLAASGDGGRTFAKRSRVDVEAEGRYAVDPYLVNSPAGRLYAAWATTSDQDTIDSYAFAASEDGGHTWEHRQTIARTRKTLGDTQERWMLGGLVAVGEDSVIVYYQDYGQIRVDGKEHRPLLAYYRVSKDAGKTFSEARLVMPRDEITEAIRSFERGRKLPRKAPHYTQTLPWMASDPSGRVVAVLQDNREGQQVLDGEPLGLWQVRLLSHDGSAFGRSEAVSAPYVAKRPPLDFMGCAVDGKYVYVVWTESTSPMAEWEFSGRLMFGRKSLRGH